MAAYNSLVSLDIETEGLNPHKDKITCVGIYHSTGGKVFRDREVFLKWLEQLDDSYSFVGQNFGFDIKFLYWQWGIDLRDKWGADTQLAAYTLTEKIPDEWLADYERKRLEVNKRDKITHRRAGKHSLKTLAPYFLGVEAFWETPDDHNNDDYVLKDCKYTYDLFSLLADKLKKLNQFEFYKMRLLPWAKMCLDMEINGMPLDLKVTNDTRARLLEDADKASELLDEEWAAHYEAYNRSKLLDLEVKYQKMFEKASLKAKDVEKCRQRYSKLLETAKSKLDSKINLDSPKQKLWLFRDRLGLDCRDFEGNVTTGAPVLRRYADQGREDIGLYLKIQEDKKLANFCDQWLDQQIDGRIYASFNLARTRTGRLSSSEPNLQQISNKLYKCFRAKEGYKLLSYDQSAIEGLLISYYSDDPVLYKVFSKGDSLHCFNTTNVFFPDLGIEPKDVKRLAGKERNVAKTLAFALFYGAGKNRIMAAYNSQGFYPSEYEVSQIYERFKSMYKVAYDYSIGIRKTMERGEVITNLLGRPLYISNPDDCFMRAFNTLIQSSASDLVVMGAYKAVKEWEESNLDCKLTSLVHDCIIAEASDKDAEAARDILIKNMTGFKLDTVHGPLELKVEGSIGQEWQK